MPGQDDGALCIADQFDGTLQTVLFHIQHGVGAIGARFGRSKVEDRLALLRVFGDIDQYGTGAAGARNLERLTQRGAISSVRLMRKLCLVTGSVMPVMSTS